MAVQPCCLKAAGYKVVALAGFRRCSRFNPSSRVSEVVAHVLLVHLGAAATCKQLLASCWYSVAYFLLVSMRQLHSYLFVRLCNIQILRAAGSLHPR
jgi:hypothetical protein